MNMNVTFTKHKFLMIIISMKANMTGTFSKLGGILAVQTHKVYKDHCNRY